MKIEPTTESALIINSAAVGTITRKMVRERSVELALINGRAAGDVSKADWEQAKRELTGGLEMEPEEALLESAPESERWDPLPGSNGQIVPVPSTDDGEDDEGTSLGERLVNEGVNEAGHDQMLQAARLADGEDSANPEQATTFDPKSSLRIVHPNSL
jgi:hypothetical protein